LRAERDELAARFSALPRATAHVSVQLVEADKALLAIRQARDAVMARSAELATKLTQANEQIAELSDGRDLAERERDAAMEQLRIAQRECSELRLKLETQQKDQSSQPGAVLAAGQSMAAMLAQYSAERTRLQQQLEEVRTAASVQSAALQAQLAARKHQAAAGGELDRQRLEIAGLRAELDSLREDLRQSRTVNREVAAEPTAVARPVEPLSVAPLERTVSNLMPEATAELAAMAGPLREVEDDPSHLEALDVLASQFQDFAQKSLSAGNAAAHRLSGICADVAKWLRKSPIKIPAGLPVLENAHQLLSRLMEPAVATKVGDPGGSSIYAVDDDVDNCECIAMALEKASMQTRYAIKAEVALAELTKGPCDLIILDVDLGGDVDGFELHSRIRKLEHHRHTPVLFISGLTGTPERIAELIGERTGFVQKPYNLNELTLHALTVILGARLARC
jgi:CheY-like chemotaxis protein